MHRKRVFRNADSVDIGQAPGRRPILEKRDIESIKAIPAEFYGPIFLLEDDLRPPPFSVALARLTRAYFLLLIIYTRHNFSP